MLARGITYNKDEKCLTYNLAWLLLNNIKVSTFCLHKAYLRNIKISVFHKIGSFIIKSFIIYMYSIYIIYRNYNHTDYCYTVYVEDVDWVRGSE